MPLHLEGLKSEKGDPKLRCFQVPGELGKWEGRTEHEAIGRCEDYREPAALQGAGFSSSSSLLIFMKTLRAGPLWRQEKGKPAKTTKQEAERSLDGAGSVEAWAPSARLWLRLHTPRPWPRLVQWPWPVKDDRGQEWQVFHGLISPTWQNQLSDHSEAGCKRSEGGRGWKHSESVHTSKHQYERHTRAT